MKWLEVEQSERESSLFSTKISASGCLAKRLSTRFGAFGANSIPPRTNFQGRKIGDSSEVNSGCFSAFIALIPSRSICPMFAILKVCIQGPLGVCIQGPLGVCIQGPWGSVSMFRKRKRNQCFAFTSRIRREIRKFPVEGVQGWQRNLHLKKVWCTYKVAVLLIYSSNTFTSCCRRRCCRWLISLFLRKTCCLSLCAISLLSGCDNTYSISLFRRTVMAWLCMPLWQ